MVGVLGDDNEVVPPRQALPALDPHEDLGVQVTHDYAFLLLRLSVPSGIRTHTVSILSRLPLPLGYRDEHFLSLVRRPAVRKVICFTMICVVHHEP